MRLILCCGTAGFYKDMRRKKKARDWLLFYVGSSHRIHARFGFFLFALVHLSAISGWVIFLCPEFGCRQRWTTVFTFRHVAFISFTCWTPLRPLKLRGGVKEGSLQ